MSLADAEETRMDVFSNLDGIFAIKEEQEKYFLSGHVFTLLPTKGHCCIMASQSPVANVAPRTNRRL